MSLTRVRGLLGKGSPTQALLSLASRRPPIVGCPVRQFHSRNEPPPPSPFQPLENDSNIPSPEESLQKPSTETPSSPHTHAPFPPRETPPSDTSLPSLSSSAASMMADPVTASASAIGSAATFSTARYAHMLQVEGFTEGQADAVLSLVTEAVSDSMESAARALVTKTDQTNELEEAESDFRQLRNEIHQLEKRDFAVLRAELARIADDVERIKNTMREEVSRVHGGVRLDINLEKARIQDEATALRDMVGKAEERIDQEIGLLTERMIEIRDGTKASLKQFIGIAFTAFLAYKVASYQQAKKA